MRETVRETFETGMSVQICPCKRPYWRYRKDFPPAGYCSVFCFENRKKKRREPPPEPQKVLSLMYEHRRDAHHSFSILEWFNCERCDELEQQYAESLDWHTDRISREIAEDGRKKRTA